MSPCWFIGICRPMTAKFSVFQKTLLICLSTLACLHIKLHSLTSERNKNYNLIKGLVGFLTTKGNGVENKWQKYLSQIGHFPVPDGCTDIKMHSSRECFIHVPQQMCIALNPPWRKQQHLNRQFKAILKKNPH